MDYEKIPGEAIGGGGVLHQAPAMNKACASESLQGRAERQAHEHAREAVRFERLAKRLTPEIQNMIWCWTESLALGLIDVRVIADAATREVFPRVHSPDRAPGAV